MSRRDTIIIAILVNAGLLLILFATAMRSGDKKKENVVELVEGSKMPSKETMSAPVSTEDLLNEYIAATPSTPVIPEKGQEELVFIEDPQGVNPTLPSTLDGASLPVATTPLAPSIIQPQPIVAVPTTAAPIAAVKAEPTKVTVKKGDYLEKIAKANGTTVQAIMKENHLASTQLKIGQLLKMPSKNSVKEKGSLEGDFYVVKAGDSPWQIANRLNIKLDDLLKINNIDEQKAKRLRPGDRLRVR